jgi:hypothetical protein
MPCRQVNGGAWSTVRQVQYSYYDGTQTYGGNVGDLMTASVLDGNNNVLTTSYYRYYTPGQPNGYTDGLHYVFNPTSYMRLTLPVQIRRSAQAGRGRNAARFAHIVVVLWG